MSVRLHSSQASGLGGDRLYVRIHELQNMVERGTRNEKDA